MRYFLFFISAMVLFGCHSPGKDPMHNGNDINEIVKAVVVQDSLYLDSIPLSIDLAIPGKCNRIVCFPLSIEELLDPTAAFQFKNSDSPYLQFQLLTLTGFTIDKSRIPKMSFTSTAERMNKSHEERMNFGLHEMSVPLFSVDQHLAYVMLTSYHGVNAGIGHVFVLKKINSRWQIIKQWESWIS